MICVARACGAGVGVGDGHHDPERRALGARREPLVAVDHPVVAVADRARAERRRVGARHLGLGHREERADLAGDERLRASAPSARRCRTGAGSRRCRRRAPGSRRRAGPTSSGRCARSDTRSRGSRCRCRPPRAARAAPTARARAPRPAAARRSASPSSSCALDRLLVREHALGHERANLLEPLGRAAPMRSPSCR